MTTSNEQDRNAGASQSSDSSSQPSPTTKVTHNLDTGEDEPLEDLEDESVMDFGSGSGGGSAGDGGAS